MVRVQKVERGGEQQAQIVIGRAPGAACGADIYVPVVLVAMQVIHNVIWAMTPRGNAMVIVNGYPFGRDYTRGKLTAWSDLDENYKRQCDGCRQWVCLLARLCARHNDGLEVQALCSYSWYLAYKLKICFSDLGDDTKRLCDGDRQRLLLLPRLYPSDLDENYKRQCDGCRQRVCLLARLCARHNDGLEVQ
ncbi:hypothetical protein MSG28_008202 [Choristoneura fumiferana]|uniref:Uncharacterized protein n=1 Tax=Choristoneura fumiferana TaxID=7141 RepID=A0ACC0JAD1_CHOFU|nr:hypothetical protein MSG28_008202 [Choristoneura fumiferana]